MGICKDKATTYLKKLGYNVVRVPEEGIAPLSIIGTQGEAVYKLGRTDDLIVNRPPNPPITDQNERAADINGQRSSKLDLGIGLDILGNVLRALGGNLGVGVSYQQAQKIEFVFQDVFSDSVEPLAVGRYLRGAEVDQDNPVLSSFVIGKGRLYLLTKTLKSKKLTVRSERSNGTEVKVDVPAMQNLVGGKVSVKADSSQSAVVTFEGETPLVFAFQAFLVGIDDGKLTLMAVQPGSVAMSLTSTSEADPVVLREHELIELQEWPEPQVAPAVGV